MSCLLEYNVGEVIEIDFGYSKVKCVYEMHLLVCTTIDLGTPFTAVVQQSSLLIELHAFLLCSR